MVHKVIPNKTSFFPKLITQNTWMYTAKWHFNVIRIPESRSNRWHSSA